MADKMRELELKIVELESRLKQLSGPDIDPEEMKTWRKVSSQLGFEPDQVCGVNECKPAVCRVCNVCRVCGGICRVCNVCRVCRVCDVCYECSCGPCNVGGFGGFHSGATGFSELG